MSSQCLNISSAAILFVTSSLALLTSCSTMQQSVQGTSNAPSQRISLEDGSVFAEHDELRIDDSLRRRFDYYLAAIDELNLSQISEKADTEFSSRLPEAAAAQAKQLFRKYMAYREALTQIGQDLSLQGGELAKVQARRDAIRAIRPRFFDARESKGLFAWQDAFDVDALARMEIARDNSLSEALKRQRLGELDARSAPDIVRSRQAPVQFLALDKQVREARAKGANDDDIFRIRAATVGEAAASRLAAVDRDAAAWQQRIAAYKLDLEAIQRDTTMDDAARKSAIQALRDARFNTLEQKRLKAFE